MKYAENAAKKQIVAFRGLNLSDNTQEGDIAAAENLSVRRFPLLSPRMQREPISDYTAPTAIFAWGKLIVVDGTSLIYDGETVGTVTTGEKQFAVVNTKLCIWPDKMYLDLNSKEFKPLNASLSSVADSQAIFTANSITMSPNVYATKTQRLTYAYGLNSYSVETPYIKTYTVCRKRLDADGRGGGFPHKRSGCCIHHRENRHVEEVCNMRRLAAKLEKCPCI